MKGIRVLSMVLFSSLGLALAATTSTPVPINAVVDNSCVVSTSAPTITIPLYLAADVTPLAGSTIITVKCNRGTQPVTSYWGVEPFLDVDLSSSTSSDKLTVTLGYGPDPVESSLSLDGADLWEYIVTATPLPGQWGASSGSYSGTQIYYIGF